MRFATTLPNFGRTKWRIFRRYSMPNGGKQVFAIFAEKRFVLSSLSGEIRGYKLSLLAEKLGNAENQSSARNLY